MAAKKKKKNNIPFGFRPNMMWLWTVVFLAIMGFALFGEGSSDPLKSDWGEVEQLIVDETPSQLSAQQKISLPQFP